MRFIACRKRSASPNLDHFKVGLGHATVRTRPGFRHVFPARTRHDTVRRPAVRFVIDKAAHNAHERAKWNVDGSGGGTTHSKIRQMGKPRILPLDYAACTHDGSFPR